MFAVSITSVIVFAPAPASAEDPPPPATPGEEITALRSETAKFFKQEDGTYLARIYPGAIHYQAPDGSWQDIVTTIVPSSRTGYAFSNQAGPVEFAFAAVARPNDTVLVSAGSETFRFGPIGVVNAQQAVVDGSTVTYPNVYPGVDLRYTVIKSGLKEEYVLHQIPAVPSFVMGYGGSLSPRAADAGQYELVNAAGDAVLRMPAPIMYDSEEEGSNEAAYSNAVSFAVGGSAGSPTLTLAFDPAWLLSPSRTWPVIVDPTILSPTSDVLVHRCYQSQNFDSGTNALDLRNGSYGTCESGSGTSLARTYMKFSSSGFSGKDITKADLKLFEYHSSSCTPKRADVRRVTQNWSASTITWATGQPSYSATASASQTVAHGWSSSCPDAWVTWNITSLFEGWVNGTYTNYGLAIVAYDESDTNSWKRYRSLEYGSNEPRLEVTYNTTPGTPTNLTPANNTITTDNTPTFSARYIDSDSGDTGYAAFEVYNAGNSLVASGHCGSVSPNATSTWPGPSGCTQTSITLGDGVYHWRARNYDGLAYSAWTGYNYLTIDTTAPAAPVVTSATHPNQSQWYSNNDPALSWTASDVSGITAYSYSRDQTENTTPDTVTEGTGTNTSYTDLADGTHYFHIIAKNGVNMWSPPRHYTLNVDVTAPTNPVITTSSHTPNVPSSDRTVEVNWLPSSDVTSGLAGYSYVFDQSEFTVPDSIVDTTQTTATSPSLGDGTWWFHVRAVDAAGNPSGVARYGPLFIDGNGPNAPTITCATHPNQNAWYPNRDVACAWTPPADGSAIAGYSVTFDQSPGTDPDETVDTTAPAWTETNVGDGTWYLHVRSVDVAGNWGATGSYTIHVDGTQPDAPGITSSTHPDPIGWFSNNDPAFSVSANALSGIAGYSYVFDQSPTTTPLPVVNSTDATPSYPDTADGAWYLHARTVSNSGLWSDTATYRAGIDVTNPNAPGTVTSPDHDTTNATNQRVITVDWTDDPGTDATSGVAGYSTVFNNSPTTAPTGPINVTGTTTESSSLADGTWYFHVVTVDRAGNRSGDKVFGPVTISGTAPPVPESRVQDFIALWQPRVESTTFGTTYVYTDGYPQEILDEGFHGMNTTQKSYLIDRLNAVVYATPVGDSAEENQAWRDTLYDFIFDKDTLRNIPNLTEWIADTAEQLAAHPDEAPAIVQSLASKALPTLPAGLPAPNIPGLVTAPVISGIPSLPGPNAARTVRNLASDTLNVVSNVTTPTVDPVSLVQDEINAVAVQTGITPSDAPVFPGLGDVSVPALTYKVCSRSAQRPDTSCALLPTPVGVATSVDVTGDGTNDVSVTFGPVVDTAYPTGQSGDLTVTRLATSEFNGSSLRAHVWVLYDMPTIQKRLLLGFDGYERGASLSNSTTARFTVKDVVAALNGDLSAHYSLTHSAVPSAWAFTFGTREMVDGTDPMDTSLRFSPVPTALNGDVNNTESVDGTTGATVRQVQVINHVTGAPPGPAGTRANLDAIVNQTRSSDGERQFTRGIVTGLANNSDVLLRHDEGGATSNQLKVALNDDQTMTRVQFARSVTKDNRSSVVWADAQSIPATASLTIIDKGDRGEATYNASSSVTKFAAAKGEYTGATLTHAVSISGTGVPTLVTLDYGASISGVTSKLEANYDANSSLTRLDAGLYQSTSQLAAVASAVNVPTELSGTLDFGAKRVDVQGNGPVGSLSFKGSVAGKKLYVPGGDHATLVHDDATGSSASAKLTGFVEAHVDYAGGDVVADTTLSPGGQPFLAAARINDNTVSVKVGQLPTTMHVDVDRDALRAHYLASSGINSLAVYANNSTTGPTVEGHFAGIPSEITVTGQLSGPTKVTYAGSSSMDSLDFLYNTSPVATNDDGTRIYGTITDLPTSVVAQADLATKEISLAAGQPVGNISAVFTKNNGAPIIPSIEHATFTSADNPSNSDDALAASVDLSGFRSLTATYGDVIEGRLQVSPGGQQFRFMGSLPNVTGYVTFSQLPTVIHVLLDPAQRHAHYDGAPAPGTITAWGHLNNVGTILAEFEDVPTSVDVTGTLSLETGGTIQYTSTGGPLGKLGAVFSPDRIQAEPPAGTGRYVGLTAHDVPSSITLVADDFIEWTSSSSLTDVTVRVRNYPVSPFAALVGVTGVPTRWRFDFGTGGFTFDGISGPLGSAFAAASNSGEPQLPSGDGIRARISLGNDTFNVGARVSNIGLVNFVASETGWSVSGSASLTGSQLGIDVHVTAPADAGSSADELTGKARGMLSRFPSAFTVSSSGDVTTYQADSNLDVTLDVEAGWTEAIANIPVIDWFHGLSVRDGGCAISEGCRPASGRLFCNATECLGARARLQLWGLADKVTIDFRPTAQRVIKIEDYSPGGSNDYLQAYVDADHIIDLPTVFVQQADIPSPVTLAFGPFKVDEANDETHLRAEMHNSAPMGALTIIAWEPSLSFANGNVLVEDFAGGIVVSSIPATLIVDAGFGKTSHVDVGVSSAIGLITILAAADITTTDKAFPDAAAGIELSNVPESLDAQGNPEIHLDLTHPETQNKPAPPGRSEDTGEKKKDPFLDFKAEACPGQQPEPPSETNPTTPTGAGSNRGADGLPTLTYEAPTGTVSVAAGISGGWVQAVGAEVDFTLEAVSMGLVNVAPRTTFTPVQNAAGLEIVSDADGSGVTGAIWVRTSFDLKVPCLDLTIPDRVHFGQKFSGRGQVKDTHVRIDDMRMFVTNVRHVTLSTGTAYLAYGVQGKYGEFGLYAPSVSVSSHSWFNMRIERGFGFGVLPDWFNQTVSLNSPDDPNDPDDVEDGWHTIFAHEMTDETGQSKLNVCAQVAWVEIACAGIATRPRLTGYRPNGAYFVGGTTSETRNVFTFVDPGTSPLFTALLDPLVALALTPPGYPNDICIHVAGPWNACF